MVYSIDTEMSSIKILLFADGRVMNDIKISDIQPFCSGYLLVSLLTPSWELVPNAKITFFLSL